MLHKASRRYARALLDLAADMGTLDAVRGDLDAISSALAGSAELGSFLNEYMLPRASRRRALAVMFEKRLVPLSWRFLLFLEERRRLGLLGDVCRAFRELHDRRQGLLHAKFASAFPVSDRETKQVTTRLQERLRCDVKMSVEVVSSLLGGFRLQVEDRLYDLSLAGALDDFRRQASGAGV
jgi:F-type H+-transporting ATPase subunit delta